MKILAATWHRLTKRERVALPSRALRDASGFDSHRCHQPAGASLDDPAIPWIFEGSSLLKIHVDYSSI